MIPPSDLFNYQLDIYSGTACWRGEFQLPSARRVQDILNDVNRPTITLENSKLIIWDNGSLQEYGAQGKITVFKQNATALLVLNATQVSTAGREVDRVKKIVHRVAVYVPPMVIVGKFHLPEHGDLVKGIESGYQHFLPLTSAAVQWLDGREPIPGSAGLAFVHRQLVASVRELPETEAGA